MKVLYHVVKAVYLLVLCYSVMAALQSDQWHLVVLGYAGGLLAWAEFTLDPRVWRGLSLQVNETTTVHVAAPDAEHKDGGGK